MAASDDQQYKRVINWAYQHGYDYHGSIEKCDKRGCPIKGIWIGFDAIHTLEAYLHYTVRYAPCMLQHTHSL